MTIKIDIELTCDICGRIERVSLEDAIGLPNLMVKQLIFNRFTASEWQVTTYQEPDKKGDLRADRFICGRCPPEARFLL